MKKFLTPLFAILFLFSCGTESMNDMQPDLEIKDNILLSDEVDQNNIAARRSPESMISVCKFDEEIGDWVVITVNGNALPALAAEGAVQLIDEDGDGYVTMENSCGIPVDCDDTDPDVTDDCDTCSDIEGLVRVTLPDGSCIYLNPEQSTPSLNWGPLVDIPDLENKTSRAAANADLNGAANTQTIVDFLGDNNGSQYPAKLCADLIAFGYDDWYLPSAGELKAIMEALGDFSPGSFYYSSNEFDFQQIWRIESGDPDVFQGVKNVPEDCLCVRK